MITVKNTQRTVVIDTQQVQTIAYHILTIIGYTDFDLGIWFTTNNTIQRYNRRYRNKNKPTDILSFAYHANMKAGCRITVKDNDDKNLGDLILSASYIAQQAKEQNSLLINHITMLLIHGICHLLGYDHEQDVDFRKMRAKEAFILKKLNQLLD